MCGINSAIVPDIKSSLEKPGGLSTGILLLTKASK